MADEWYSPKRAPRPAATPKPSERLWELRKNHVTWSADLVFCGESWGWDARTWRDGEFSRSHRFLLRADAVRWAERERADIERGFDTTDFRD